MKTFLVKSWTFALLLLVATSASVSAQTFNEIRISSPGAEDDVSNFVELFGIAGTSLDGLSILSISSEFNPGEVSFAFDLSGTQIPTDGFYLASTDLTEYADTDLATAADFFGSPQSFLLVDSFTAAEGDDLDADDDGLLDAAAPWTSIIDSVNLADGDANTDFAYGPGPTVGPDGTFTPAHIFRDVDGAGSFQIGAFGDRTADTPGTANAPVAIPEPSSLALVLCGIAAISTRRRRK